MAKVKKKPKVAPPAGPDRLTPRMLARVLKKTRETGTDTGIALWAKEFGIAQSTLRKWENPPENFALDVNKMLGYQDFKGIPASVFFVIAQFGAAVRDNKPDRLKLLAEILERLTARVLRPEPLAHVMSYIPPGSNPLHVHLWDNLLADLLMTVWAMVADEARSKVWRDEQRAIMRRKAAKKPSTEQDETEPSLIPRKAKKPSKT